MNAIVTQVHDALRNYRSLLTRDVAKKGSSLVEKKEGVALQHTDLIHISKEAFDKIAATREKVNNMEALLSQNRSHSAIQEKKVGLLEDRSNRRTPLRKF